MAFPTDLEIEVAFNNDIDETDYAQSGWTSILPFVAGFSGDLRGRGYELDRADAGSISVSLDNSDSRFLPGSVQSPYYPYVKSDRRFRIRGKNMVHPNVARGGSRDRNLNGFLDFTNTEAGYADIWPLGTFGEGAYAMDSVRIVTASAEPNAGIGQGKENVNDGLATTMWTINTQAGWLQYKLAIGVRITRYTLTIPAGNATRNPDDWTFQGSNNGSSWTTLHTVTGNVWTEDYEAQEFTVTTPGFYLYYKLDITGNTGAVANTQLAGWDINYDDPATDLLLVDADLTHFIETTIPASQADLNAWHRTTSWYIPVEYGSRLSHSAYVWRISGIEPTGFKYKLHVNYFDSEWVEVNAATDPQWEVSTLQTTQTPTQIGFSHTPPSTAKYGVVSFSYYLAATTNSTDLVYGITGIQSELPANLAPDVSGFRDQFNWQIESAGEAGTYANVGSDPTTSYLSVTWAVDDTNLYITIPHLIPGEWYTATVQAQKVGSQPNLLFTGDEGESGALINTTSMAQYTISFQAQQAESELRFVLQGTPTAAEGLRLRKLRVERGNALSLTLPTTGIESGVTSWIRPKDIFEGWIESWPARAGSLEMTITVVDRMKRVGEVELSNTLKESLMQDGPALLMPLSDSMLDTPGRFSQLGYWADVEGGPTYVDISKTRGDIGIASYTTQTDDGPTGEASWKNNPIKSPADAGYLFAIPFSKDFSIPVPPPAGTPVPKPPPSKPKPTETPKYTYTKKWYATWSRSYEGNDSTRFDDSDYMYQGQFSGSPGNQKSLAGFDYKNIMATLAGAEILEAHITVKNDHARWNKGLYVFVGTHNYSSKGSTWVGAQVRERRWKKWVTEGGSVTIDGGTSFGNELKAGTSRGIGIGPEADSDHYGFFRGAKQSGKPFITVKYRK